MFGRSRKRLGSAMFYVLGPAAVDGALQGHSPEARAQWKSLVEANRRARAEARREKDLEATADGAVAAGAHQVGFDVSGRVE